MTLYNAAGQQVFHDNVQGQGHNWHWVKGKKVKIITPGRYYLVLSDVKTALAIDQIVVKTAVKNALGNEVNTNQHNYSIQSTTPTAPSLPTESPWVKQGLNPFASLLQNGNEYVSTTFALLTISATDVTVPGCGGLNLTISRFYNSKAHNSDRSSGKYPLLADWQFGFPSATTSSVSFPNGSECNLNDDEVAKSVEELENKDKVYTYINAVNTYFKLVRYERFTHCSIGEWFPQYETDHYELYLADGSYYYFDGSGKIKVMYGPNRNNKIEFSYIDGKIDTITDSLTHKYIFTYGEKQVKVTRYEDQKVLVTYNYVFSDTSFTVTDALDRITSYKYCAEGISRITYPSGKRSEYTYEVNDVKDSYYLEDGTRVVYVAYSLYWVKGQAVFLDGETNPVKRTVFSPVFSDADDRKIRFIVATQYDENNTKMLRTFYHSDTHVCLYGQK